MTGGKSFTFTESVHGGVRDGVAEGILKGLS